jgi:diguanylate cyclase (GGDEF)-like protein
MFVDLDRFKQINDTLGHEVGDKLLVAVADRLKRVLREGDTVARVGGDEFVVVLPELGKDRDAAVVARKILDLLAEPFRIESHELPVTPSIGIASHRVTVTAGSNTATPMQPCTRPRQPDAISFTSTARLHTRRPAAA